MLPVTPFPQARLRVPVSRYLSNLGRQASSNRPKSSSCRTSDRDRDICAVITVVMPLYHLVKAGPAFVAFSVRPLAAAVLFHDLITLADKSRL